MTFYVKWLWVAVACLIFGTVSYAAADSWSDWRGTQDLQNLEDRVEVLEHPATTTTTEDHSGDLSGLICTTPTSLGEGYGCVPVTKP